MSAPTRKEQERRFVSTLIGLAFFGALAGFYYGRDVAWTGVPWWVAAVLAGSEIGAICRHAWAVPCLFGMDEPQRADEPGGGPARDTT